MTKLSLPDSPDRACKDAARQPGPASQRLRQGLLGSDIVRAARILATQQMLARLGEPEGSRQ